MKADLAFDHGVGMHPRQLYRVVAITTNSRFLFVDYYTRREDAQRRADEHHANGFKYRILRFARHKPKIKLNGSER